MAFFLPLLTAAGKGALTGAAVGAGVSAATGNNLKDGALKGAAGGAITGGIGGGIKGLVGEATSKTAGMADEIAEGANVAGDAADAVAKTAEAGSNVTGGSAEGFGSKVKNLVGEAGKEAAVGAAKAKAVDMVTPDPKHFKGFQQSPQQFNPPPIAQSGGNKALQMLKGKR